MTKYIKQRLSVKIFIITFFLLGAACGGTYFFISKLLPATYSNLINASTEKAAMHLVEQMTAFDNISDCENDISNFSKETNAAFWIEDSNGRMIYPAEASMETSTTSADCTVTFDEDESIVHRYATVWGNHDKFLPVHVKKRHCLCVGSSNGFVRCTAGNKGIAVYSSVCYPNGLSAFASLCMALYTVYH